MDNVGVEVQAILTGFRSTVDGGTNFTFSVSLNDQDAAMRLMRMRDQLVMLACVLMEDPSG